MKQFLILSLILSTLAFGNDSEQRQPEDCFYAGQLLGFKLKTDYDAWSSENEIGIWWSVFNKDFTYKRNISMDPKFPQYMDVKVTKDRFNFEEVGYKAENIGNEETHFESLISDIDSIPDSKLDRKNNDSTVLSYTVREYNLVGYSTVLYLKKSIPLRNQDWKNFTERTAGINIGGKVYTHSWTRKGSNDDGEISFKFYRGCRKLNPDKVTSVHKEKF